MVQENRQLLMSMRYGLFLALVTLLYGFGLGASFGIYEGGIKSYLKDKAHNVFATAYDGDEVKLKKVTSKSWVYLKRAHIHANGLGTTSLVLILLLSYLPSDRRLKAAISSALGVGALGYSSFWMFAGMMAPGLGSTGLAKESLKWLAMPSAGLCILGLISVTLVMVKYLFLDERNDDESLSR